MEEFIGSVGLRASAVRVLAVRFSGSQGWFVLVYRVGFRVERVERVEGEVEEGLRCIGSPCFT